MDKHFASANNESDVSGGVGTDDATNSNPADSTSNEIPQQLNLLYLIQDNHVIWDR